MKTYSIYTRNQAGTTLYRIGSYKTKREAKQEAIKNYGWYRADPNKYKIVEA